MAGTRYIVTEHGSSAPSAAPAPAQLRPTAKVAIVSATATGIVFTLSRLLDSTSQLALINGSNPNLKLNAATGAISATSAVGSGVSQKALVRENDGEVALEYPVTITGEGVLVIPVPVPTVAISAAQSKSEGNNGTTNFVYTVTRSTSIGAASVAWSFVPNSTSANDFVGSVYPAGGTVELADGVATGTFSVGVTGDTVIEADESFTVSISAPAGYGAGASMSAIGTILNDDTATAPATPTISVTQGNAQNTIKIVDGSDGGAAITAHKLFRGSAAGAETFVGTIPIASGLTYVDTQLTNGATYFYRVSVVNAANLESPLSDSASGTPSGGNGLTANQQLLAALPPRPLVAELGGSRERQNGIASGTQTRSLTSGQLVWAEMLDPRLFRTSFAYSNTVDANSNGLTGMLFANDGNGAWDQFQRIPSVLASDANVVVVAMSSNTVQSNDYDIYHNDLGRSLTVANYVSLHQQICLALINGGKAVIFKEIWERGVFNKNGSTVGGVWTSGSTPRSLIPLINSTMKAWCQQQGIPFLDVRSTMTTTQVNGNNTDTVPVAEYVRDDSTHLSAKGGKVMAGLYNALFANLFTRAAEFDETAAGNFVANPTFTGTGGVVPTSFAAGSVAPDNVTLMRDAGTTATVTSAIVLKNGRRWLEFSINRSSMPDAGTQESLAFTVATAGAPTATYLGYRIRQEVDAGDWYATPHISGPSTWAMIPINSGGSGVTDSTGAMEQVSTTGYAGVLKTMPSTVTTATPSYTVRTPSFRKGDGSTLKVRFAAPELRVTTDPHLLMYNEANTTPPTVTSSTTLAAPEEQPFSSIITTSIPARLSLSGDDAALLSLRKSGLLTMRTTPDFESPADLNGDNVYSFNVILTPYNTAVAPVVVPMTLTIADIPDGSVYKFTAANGVDVMALYPGVTSSPAYVAGALFVSGNVAKNLAGGSGGSLYFPPEAVNGNTEVRVRHTTSNASGPGIIVRIDTTSNDRVTAGWSSAALQIGRVKAGVSLPTVTLTPYITPSTTTSGSQDFIYQIINDVLRVYQNGVEITAAAGIDVAGCASTSNVSGLSASSSSSNNGTIDTFNPRPSVPRTSRVVLKALTLTNDTLVAGQNYAGTITNYTGTPEMAVTADSSGLFYVDGFNVRTTEPLVTGQVYSFTVAEPNDNAVNSPRPTTFSVTGP